MRIYFFYLHAGGVSQVEIGGVPINLGNEAVVVKDVEQSQVWNMI